MNTENIEQELRELFSELRAHEERLVPPFKAVNGAATLTTSTPRRISPWIRIVAGATTALILIAGICLAVFRTHARESEGEMQRWAALSDWEAPTDSLLSISDMPWGSKVTTPSDSLINITPDLPDIIPDDL